MDDHVLMAILIFVLAYSSVIAAYVYPIRTCPSCVATPRGRRGRCASCVALRDGRRAFLPRRRVERDIAMAVTTITNLVALVFLARWVLGRCATTRNSVGAASPNPSSWGEEPAAPPATFPATSGSARRSNPERQHRRVRLAHREPGTRRMHTGAASASGGRG